MKHSTHTLKGKVVLVALGLLLSAAAPESALARQSERSRERTRSTRVERRPDTKKVQPAAKPSNRTPSETRSAAKAPSRDTRSQAAQRAPSRDTRGQEAQRAPSRDTRGQAAQRAPSRDTRGQEAQRAPSRDNRGQAAQRAPSRDNRGQAAQRAPSRDTRGQEAQRAPSRDNRGQAAQRDRDLRDRNGSRDTRLNGGRESSLVVGTRSTLRRERYRRAVLIRPHVVPTYRYRPYVAVWSRPVIRARWPHLHVHLDWPWLIRYERRWAPRYRYRQVIRVEVYHDGRRDWSDVEVETFYRHTVRRATADWAEIDIEIDQIDVYDGNRYLGYVDRLPAELRTIRATVYRNGEINFDREVFLVGDPRIGFEVVSTRRYDGWVQDYYRSEDGYRAGRVDLRRHRVHRIRRSRLWSPYRYTGVVPVSLLPDQQGWLWDYGIEALSAADDNYDWYYGGSGARAPSEDPGLYGADEWSYQTRDGADVRYERESNLERVR